MITQNQIDQFYKDVEGLKLKFPVAAITKATGESKGNVSRYLNKKLEPSEPFLKKFYDSFKIVSRDTLSEQPTNESDKQAVVIDYELFKQLIAEKEARRQEAEKLAQLMEKHYNDARADRVELVADKNKLYSVLESMQKTIDLSLTKANQYLGAILRVTKADDAVSMDSLDRLEGHPEGTNRTRSGRIQKVAKEIQNQKDKRQKKGT